MSKAVIPTEGELQALPRWGNVYFAARCARRVLPLLEGEIPSPRAVVRIAGLAVDVAETFATILATPPAESDRDIRNATLLYLAALAAAKGSGLAAALGSVSKSPAHHRIQRESRNAARAADEAGRLIRRITSDLKAASLVPRLLKETKDAVTAALHIAGLPYADDQPKGGGVRVVGEVGIRRPESATNNDAVLTLIAIGSAISDASTIGGTLWPGEAIAHNALALVGNEAVTRALPPTSAVSVARAAAETAAKANATHDPVLLGVAAYVAVSTAGALAPEIVSAIRRDFEHLRATATRMGWTNDTPVPWEVCGPLWENGPPLDWPDSTYRSDPVLTTLRAIARRQASAAGAQGGVIQADSHALRTMMEMPDPWYMAGTEGSGEYVVILRTPLGRVGYRKLTGDSYRIRVEPTPVGRVPLEKLLTPSDDWKQPGQQGRDRFSLVVKTERKLCGSLSLAVLALSPEGIGGEVNPSVPERDKHIIEQAVRMKPPPAGRVVKPHADVLLVTVNPHETRSVVEAFKQATGNSTTRVPIEDRLYHYLGIVNGTSVFLALSEMGSGGLGATQQTVEKGIRAVNPEAVIAVGIAFGINEKRQAIGDILVSKQLRLYDLQRAGSKIILRGDKPHASTWLINYFEGIAQTSWQGSRVRAGVILTGEKLVDNVDYRNQLHNFEPEAIGGEMEGAGLYVASHEHKVDWIVIKAVCDWGDGKKAKNKEARQRKAARNACEFLLHSLQQAPLKRQAR